MEGDLLLLLTSPICGIGSPPDRLDFSSHPMHPAGPVANIYGVYPPPRILSTYINIHCPASVSPSSVSVLYPWISARDKTWKALYFHWKSCQRCHRPFSAHPGNAWLVSSPLNVSLNYSAVIVCTGWRPEAEWIINLAALKE